MGWQDVKSRQAELADQIVEDDRAFAGHLLPMLARLLLRAFESIYALVDQAFTSALLTTLIDEHGCGQTKSALSDRLHRGFKVERPIGGPPSAVGLCAACPRPVLEMRAPGLALPQSVRAARVEIRCCIFRMPAASALAGLGDDA
jgi:hypothetical protein